MAWKFAGKFGSDRVEDEIGHAIGTSSVHSRHVSVTIEYGGTTFKYRMREDLARTIGEAEAFVRSDDAVLDARINASKNQLYPVGSNWVLLEPRHQHSRDVERSNVSQCDAWKHADEPQDRAGRDCDATEIRN